MNEHNGSRFAHITRAHPCFNEKMHDKLTMKRTDRVLQDAL